MREKIYEKLEQGLKAKKSVVIKIGGRRLAVNPDRTRDRWTICWHDGIKRHRKFISDEAEVRRVVERIVAAFEQGEKVVDNLSAERLSDYIDIDTTLRGVNLHELVAHYKAHVNQQSTPLSEVCEKYRESISGKSERHQNTVRLHLKKLCAAFKGSISAIKATDIDEYLKGFPGAKTKKNHRVTICSVFAFAQRKGILPFGFTEAQKSERPTTLVVEPCVVSSVDMTKLLSECSNKRLASYIAIAAFAGVRSAEIQRLKWSDIRDEVDDEGFGAIVLGPRITKTNRRRIAEVPPNLKAWVDKLRGEPDDFVTYPEERFYVLYDNLQKLCKKLAVTKQQNAFRHTFVSCHLELHRDGPRTAKSAGHSLSMLETNYLKLVSRSEAEAWFNIFPAESRKYDPVVIRPIRSRRLTKDLVEERNSSFQVNNNNNDNPQKRRMQNHP